MCGRLAAWSSAVLLGTPMESMGLNTQGTFALNRSGVDDLISRAKAATEALGSLSRMLEQEPRKRPTRPASGRCAQQRRRAADDTLGRDVFTAANPDGARSLVG